MTLSSLLPWLCCYFGLKEKATEPRFKTKIQFLSSKHSSGTKRVHQTQALCSSSGTLSSDGRAVTPTCCWQGYRYNCANMTGEHERHSTWAWQNICLTESKVRPALEKVYKIQWIPWWKSRKWLLTLSNVTDSLAWPMPSSAMHHVGREINILRMAFGITVVGTPHFTRGLTSHLHGFSKI